MGSADALSVTWTCVSVNPGRAVAHGQSIVRLSAGVGTSRSEPIATMRPSATWTTRSCTGAGWKPSIRHPTLSRMTGVRTESPTTLEAPVVPTA